MGTVSSCFKWLLLLIYLFWFLTEYACIPRIGLQTASLFFHYSPDVEVARFWDVSLTVYSCKLTICFLHVPTPFPLPLTSLPSALWTDSFNCWWIWNQNYGGGGSCWKTSCSWAARTFYWWIPFSTDNWPVQSFACSLATQTTGRSFFAFLWLMETGFPFLHWPLESTSMLLFLQSNSPPAQLLAKCLPVFVLSLLFCCIIPGWNFCWVLWSLGSCGRGGGGEEAFPGFRLVLWTFCTVLAMFCWMFCKTFCGGPQITGWLPSLLTVTDSLVAVVQLLVFCARALPRTFALHSKTQGVHSGTQTQGETLLQVNSGVKGSFTCMVGTCA